MLRIALALLLLAPATSLAALGDQDNAKVAVHLIPKPAKGTICDAAPAEYGCDAWNVSSNLETQGDILTSYYMYVVILDINTGPGLAGAAFGIDYNGSGGNGVDFFGYESCADIEFPDPNWPNNPPAGNTLTWDSGANCQNSPDPSDPQGEGSAVACGFYVYAYSPDQFRIIKRPVAVPDYKLSDCTAAESNPPYPCSAGVAGFGGLYGHDPCGFVDPVEAVTWGGLKRQFREDGE